MRKVLGLLLIATFAASAAFAHGGKSHHLLGTVKLLHENHLVVTATDGHETTVTLTDATQYEKDKKPATRAALAAGARVSIKLSEDDKTAVKVKIGTTPAK
jgi:predicted DNA binding CopG/RHH family protein